MSLTAQFILIESPSGCVEALSQRILSFGIDPIQLADLPAAMQLMSEGRSAIDAIFIPTDIEVANLKKILKKIRKLAPANGVRFVSVGKRPSDDERKRLRSAGMTLSLWDPFDDGALRFQLNRALVGDRDEHCREYERVPTFALATVIQSERRREAVIYSLSEGGAFLETPRAAMDGARVQIELHLPTSPEAVTVTADVIFTNVPGNLQRPNLPLGMGVSFQDIDAEARQAIARYVDERLHELSV
jgi:Tfp pilus assembly protein PilZ